MTHEIVTRRPFCGDCGHTRTDRYCPTCCYPLCSGCAVRHEEN